MHTKKFTLTASLLIIVSLVSLTATAQNTWAQLPNFGFLNSGINGATGFSIGDKGYIGTGSNTNYFWKYDTQTYSWTQAATFPGSGRTGAVGFSINGKGYVGLGSAGGTVSDFYEYDPVANTWTWVTNFPAGPRRSAISFIIGNKAYVGLGVDENNVRKSDFWEFDPSTYTWTAKADFTGGARSGATGISIGAKGYVGMGSSTTGDKKDFWEYDPPTNAWAQKADLPGITRPFALGFSLYGRGYLGTGANNLADFYEYTVATNSWTQMASIPTPRSGGVGFAIGNIGYVGSGLGPGPAALQDFWMYTPNACAGAGITNNSITPPATTNFCGPATPAVINGSEPVSSEGAYTFQWCQGYNNAGYFNIAGATARDYTPGNISQTTYIRRIVQSGTCSDTTSPVVINITQPVTPAITIVSNTSNFFCGASSITFKAFAVDTGSAPVYQWKRNTVNVGTGGPVFTSSTLTNHDTISCTLTSNACVTTNTVTSNKIIVRFGTTTKTMAYVTVSASGGDTLRALNTETGIIESSLTISGVSSANGAVAVSPDGKKVYVTNWAVDSMVVVNTLTNTIDTSILVGNGPIAIAVNPGGTRLYVVNLFDFTVKVINTSTYAVVATIPVGTNPAGICVSPDGSRVYVTNAISNTVSVINAVSNGVIYNIPVSQGPNGICISPDGSRVYVTHNINAGTVSVISTALYSVLTTIAVAVYPHGVCISPDGSKLFVANGGSGSISVINTTSNTIITTASVGNGPSAISVTPDGSKVFCVNTTGGSMCSMNTSTYSVNFIFGFVAAYALGNFIGTVVSDPLYTWTGTVSSAWENPGNWSCGVIPDPTTNVVISTGSTVVINSNVIINSITVNTGAQLTINTGFNLTVLH